MRQDAHHLVNRPALAHGDVLNRLREEEDVLVLELALRIGKRVARLLNPEAPSNERSVVAEEAVDLGRGPDVEGAFTGGVHTRGLKAGRLGGFRAWGLKTGRLEGGEARRRGGFGDRGVGVLG